MPWISDRMTNFLPSVISPMAIPATGFLIGTPASISDNVEPHTDAMLVDPLEDIISDTTLMVYGNSSSGGNTGSSARSANAPWPTSRRLGQPSLPTSPTVNGGM